MKEKLKNILLWIGGMLFIIMFVALCEKYFLASIILLIIGLLMIPPVNEMILEKLEDKEKIKKYTKSKKIVSIILFLVAVILIGNTKTAIETNTNNNTNKEKVEINSDIKSIDKDKVDSSVSKTIKENNGEYIGERINGKKQGKGKFVWNDGTIYEGDFEEDDINGKGKLIYNNKETYEGDFINSSREGKGIFTFKNGDKYEGEWKLDKMTGKGTYIFANGDKYEGDFLDNQFNGTGTYTKGNKKYTGTWKENNYLEK